MQMQIEQTSVVFRLQKPCFSYNTLYFILNFWGLDFNLSHSLALFVSHDVSKPINHSSHFFHPTPCHGQRFILNSFPFSDFRFQDIFTIYVYILHWHWILDVLMLHAYFFTYQKVDFKILYNAFYLRITNNTASN